MAKCDYLIAAGGTGGHVFPALSVALALRYIGYRVQWLGQANSLEERVATAHDIPFVVQQSPCWYGRTRWEKLAIILPLYRAISHMAKQLKEIQPQVVIGFGGHVTVPVGICAWWQKRLLAIHEQNAIPGKANWLLSFFAQVIMVAYPQTFQHNSRTIVTGNPLRSALTEAAHAARAQSRKLAVPIRVLILGGSAGSVSMNNAVVEAFMQLGQDFTIWHQTGEKDADSIRARYEAHQKDAYVDSFIEDMAAAYSWADVVVSRAGALSIAEIVAFAKPCILIPNPRCANNHQVANAMHYVEQKVATCSLEDNPQLAQELAGKLMYWSANPQAYYAVVETAKALSDQDALETVVTTCRHLYQGQDAMVEVDAVD
jgi:UDP-N-acetylglucosamine--N-acetylmuramyl-(pentapeptide) pyrophosphoryl-undecaprenol N-acetylglucosamine transferase